MNRRKIAERTVGTQNKRSKVQTKPMPKAQPKTEAKTQPKTQPKAQPKAQHKAQPKPMPKAQPKPELKAQSKAQPKTQSKAQSKAQPKTQSKVQPEARRKTPPTTKDLLRHIRKLQKIIRKQNRKILALAVINVTLLGALTAMLVVPKTISKSEAAEEEAVVLQQKSSAKESSEEESSEEESSEEESSEEVSDESSEEDTERYQYSEEDALFFDKVFHTECGASWWSEELKRCYAEVMDNNVQAYGIEDGLVWPKFECAKGYNYVVVHDKEVTEDDLDPENRELARKVREGEVERLLPEDFRCLLPAADCFFREDGTYYDSVEDFALECGIEEFYPCGNSVFFPERCWTDEVQAAMDRYNAGWAATVAAAVTAAAATD